MVAIRLWLLAGFGLFCSTSALPRADGPAEEPAKSIGASALITPAPSMERIELIRRIDTLSVYSVILTAVPSSILSALLTNPVAATSMVLSAFATGAPSWFTALPPDIQTYLWAGGVTTTGTLPKVPTSAVPSSTPTLNTSRPTAVAPTGTVQPSIVYTTLSSSTLNSSPISTGTSDSNHNNSGLSTGAKIGIGVGATLGGLALAAGLIAAYIIGKRKKVEKPAEQPPFETHAPFQQQPPVQPNYSFGVPPGAYGYNQQGYQGVPQQPMVANMPVQWNKPPAPVGYPAVEMPAQ